MPDAATDVQPEQIAPPDIPSNGPAVPPTLPSALAPSSPAGQPTAPSGVTPTNLPLPPKETFAEGIERGGNQTYTTTADGQVINAAPARRASMGGILGEVLRGAMEGAQRGIASQAPAGSMGRGAAFSAAARAAMEGKIAADERARKIAQQNFLNKQAATAAKIKNNLDLAETAHITQVMNHEAEQEPGILRARDLENEAAELRIRGGQQQLLQDSLTFQDTLAKSGMDPQFMQLFTEHSPALTAQVPALVGGAAKMIQNGKRGSENGAVVMPTSALQSTIIPPGEHLVYNTYGKTDANGKLIPGSIAHDKNGVPIPTPQVITGDGKASLLDYYNAYLKGRSQLYQEQQKIQADMTMEQHNAAVAQARSEAYKNRASAEATLAEAGLGPGGSGDRTKIGDAYIATLPPQSQDIVNGLLRYQLKPTDLGRSKDRKVMIAEAIHADPTWSEAQYEERYKFLSDYGSAKGAAGAQRIRLNTALGHLDALGEAAKDVAQGVPISNWVLNHFGVQAGATPMITYNIIANKAAGEMAGAIKGGTGSATDQEIDKALKSYNPNLSPAQQLTAVKTSMQLLNTVGQSIGSMFQSTMGKSADAFGQPVISPQNQQVMNKWLGGGGQTQGQFPPVPVNGKMIPANADGTYTIGQQKYVLSPDGTHLLPAPPK